MQKSADDEEIQKKIEQIVAAYASEVWNTLAYDMVPILTEAGQASGETALAKIEGETIAEFRETVTANISVRGVFDEVNRDAAEYATKRAAEMVGKRLVNGILIENPDAKWRIDQPTRDWIRQSVAEAFEEGMSPAELGKLLQSNYAFSKARAKMISFTEVGNINVRTHAQAAEKSGATHKRSHLSADHDRDDFCDLAAAEGEVPFDFDYGFGLKWPLFHPRCHCSETFYFREVSLRAAAD